MYQNKEQIATLLYEALDDAILGSELDDVAPVSIDDLLTPKQKYYLIMTILNALPSTNHEKVIEFNRSFDVPKEETHMVSEFKYKELRLKLILEEVLELSTALGYSRGEVYKFYVELQDKVFSKEHRPSLTDTFDALLDLLYVTYGAIDVFNFNDVSHEGMEEVHNSNMSKLLHPGTSESDLKQIVSVLNAEGFKIRTDVTSSKHLVIRDADTGKVLKPLTYEKPNLVKIIENHLNK